MDKEIRRYLAFLFDAVANLDFAAMTDMRCLAPKLGFCGPIRLGLIIAFKPAAFSNLPESTAFTVPIEAESMCKGSMKFHSIFFWSSFKMILTRRSAISNSSLVILPSAL